MVIYYEEYYNGDNVIRLDGTIGATYNGGIDIQTVHGFVRN
jgi:hypothetical protein